MGRAYPYVHLVRICNPHSYISPRNMWQSLPAAYGVPASLTPCAIADGVGNALVSTILQGPIVSTQWLADPPIHVGSLDGGNAVRRVAYTSSNALSNRYTGCAAPVQASGAKRGSPWHRSPPRHAATLASLAPSRRRGGSGVPSHSVGRTSEHLRIPIDASQPLGYIVT